MNFIVLLYYYRHQLIIKMPTKLLVCIYFPGLEITYISRLSTHLLKKEICCNSAFSCHRNDHKYKMKAV